MPRYTTAVAAAGFSLIFASTAVAADLLGDAVPDGREWYQCPADHKGPNRYYPAKAQKTNIEGVAKIQCRFQIDGFASECVWLTEPAPDLGFGSTAEQMGCMFRMQNIQPLPTGQLPVIKIPIKFTLPR